MKDQKVPITITDQDIKSALFAFTVVRKMRDIITISGTESEILSVSEKNFLRMNQDMEAAKKPPKNETNPKKIKGKNK